MSHDYWDDPVTVQYIADGLRAYHWGCRTCGDFVVGIGPVGKRTDDEPPVGLPDSMCRDQGDETGQ